MLPLLSLDQSWFPIIPVVVFPLVEVVRAHVSLPATVERNYLLRLTEPLFLYRIDLTLSTNENQKSKACTCSNKLIVKPAW